MLRRWALLILLALGVALPGTVAAQGRGQLGFRGWGPRVGITSNPDQVHLGAHIDFGDVSNHVRFQPNVEVGLGDGRTLAAFNFEAAYRFLSTWGRWSPYLGGGLGLNNMGHDRSFVEDSSSELGASVLGGVEKGLSGGNRLFLEAKMGMVDAPDLKLTLGWTLYR